VLTFQERPGDCFGMVRNRLRDPNGQMQKRGADYLAYALLDAVVDAYFPLLEKHDGRLEALEHTVLDGTARGQRAARTARRAPLPARPAARGVAAARGDELAGARRATATSRPTCMPYLRDVADHVVQLLDLLERPPRD
jgi:magnesium transporter